MFCSKLPNEASAAALQHLNFTEQPASVVGADPLVLFGSSARSSTSRYKSRSSCETLKRLRQFYARIMLNKFNEVVRLVEEGFCCFFFANHEGVISVQTPTEIYNRQPAQNETTKVQENGLAIWGKIVWSWTLVVAVAWWEHCVVRWTFCVCFFDTKSWQLDWISLAWTGLASVGSSSGKSNIETGEGDYITLANCVIWGKIKLNGVFV